MGSNQDSTVARHASTGYLWPFFLLVVIFRFRPCPKFWCHEMGALACSFSTPTLYILVLTHGILPAFRDGLHLSRQPLFGQSQVYEVTLLCIDGFHHLESTVPGPLIIYVVPFTCAAILGNRKDVFFCAFLFPWFALVHAVDACSKDSSFGGNGGFISKIIVVY